MTDSVATAERMTWWRMHLACLLGIVMVTQGGRVADMQIIHPNKDATVISWVTWIVVLIFFAMFASGLWQGARLRTLLNDEGSRANRQIAVRTGFWAMLAVSVGCYVASHYIAMETRPTLHVVVAMGVGAALLTFSRLERRALRG